MDRLQALKSVAHGEGIEKGANLAEILDVGMTALMLHNTLHGRASDDDGPDFDKSELDGLFGAIEMSIHPGKRRKKKKVRKEDGTDRPPVQGLLEQLKQYILERGAPEQDSADILQFTSTPIAGVKIAKAIDEERGLVTAIILRPDVADLHGDIYDAGEVEKACFNFNTRCRQTNIQHEKMADFDMVESYIAKADFALGEGQVLAGDWLGTMFIDPVRFSDQWAAVKSGEFTGFSIGCKASVETI